LIPDFVAYDAELDEDEEEVIAALVTQKIDTILLPHVSPLGGPYFRIRYARKGTQPDVQDMFVGSKADPSRVRARLKKGGLVYAGATSQEDSMQFVPVGDARDCYFAGLVALASERVSDAKVELHQFLNLGHYGELRAWAYLHLAKLAWGEGDKDHAWVYSEMSLRVFPLPDAWVLRGILQCSTQDAKGLEALRKGWKLAETQVDLHPFDEMFRYKIGAMWGAWYAKAQNLHRDTLDFANVVLQYAPGDYTATKQAQYAQEILALERDVPKNKLRVAFSASIPAHLVALLHRYTTQGPAEYVLSLSTDAVAILPEILVVTHPLPEASPSGMLRMQQAKAVLVLSKADHKNILARFPFVERKLGQVVWGVDTEVKEEDEKSILAGDTPIFAHCFDGHSSGISDLLSKQAVGAIPLVLAGTSCEEYITEGFLFRGVPSGQAFERAVRRRIVVLLGNPHELKALRARIREAVRQKFDWSVVAEGWADVLTAFLAVGDSESHASHGADTQDSKQSAASAFRSS